MMSISRSKFIGALVAAAAVAVTAYSVTSAEVVATINGVDVDSTVFEAYLETRFQKPAAEATAEERATVQREITDGERLGFEAHQHGYQSPRGAVNGGCLRARHVRSEPPSSRI